MVMKENITAERITNADPPVSKEKSQRQVKIKMSAVLLLIFLQRDILANTQMSKP